MAQWEKVLAAKHDDLSVISRTHMVEGDNWIHQIVPDPTCALWQTAHTYTHEQSKKASKIF